MLVSVGYTIRHSDVYSVYKHAIRKQTDMFCKSVLVWVQRRVIQHSWNHWNVRRMFISVGWTVRYRGVFRVIRYVDCDESGVSLGSVLVWIQCRIFQFSWICRYM